MHAPSADGLVEAVSRAVATYREPRQWRILQLNGMAREFGWAKAAREYVGIYQRIAR